MKARLCWLRGSSGNWKIYRYLLKSKGFKGYGYLQERWPTILNFTRILKLLETDVRNPESIIRVLFPVGLQEGRVDGFGK